MITEHIIENLGKELKNRDERIKLLKIKNSELNSIFNDWICKDLGTPAKKFPDDYIKQKKEFAKTITNLRDEEKKVSEILNLQDKRHKEEIDRLKFEIELLQKQIPRKSIFKSMLGV